MRRLLGVLVVTLATFGVMASSAAAATITSRGPAWHAQWNPGSQSALKLNVPGGTPSPGSWTTLASIADPIPMGAVSLRIVAGTNVSSTDIAQFDDVSTS